MKDSFYKELKCVISKFPKYHMKDLLEDFNAKVDGEYILNQKIGMKVYMELVIIMELD
jgi:hypothetical protein